MTNRKVLVVSNNCFSPSNSNGRTLGNLFYGWPKENLAQFCVIAKDPAWNMCDNYYCLEDRAMFAAFRHGQKAVGRKLQFLSATTLNESETKRYNLRKKTLLKIILRELVWSFNRWRSNDFEQWVDDFAPDVVVLQLGDSSFMIDIALYVAQSRHIPLLVYNTEGYYFFNEFWHDKSCLDCLLFPFYRRYFQHRVKCLMDYAYHTVYLNKELKEDYDNAFNKPSTIIYNSSSMHRGSFPVLSDRIPVINYLGGLGHGRDSAIEDVGEVLHEIDSRLFIGVYGPADECVKKRLSSAVGVKYYGTIPYLKVRDVINDSDILFHVEPPLDKDRQLRYAFSGKIADSIMSGKCFIIYAPKDLACSKYILDNRCGWFADTKDDLREVVLRVLKNDKERTEILETARKIAMQNHSLERNAQKFQSTLLMAK